MILWQYFIPLVVFVVAYWKILGVIRRQAKVATNLAITTFAREPVAGTSAGTSDENRGDEAVNNETVTVTRLRGQTNGSTNLSKAQINVMRTMIYITVCFMICWMPLYFIRTVKRIRVCYFFSVI